MTRPATLDRSRSAPPPARDLWPDAARGAGILLVVLWHVGTKHTGVLPWVPPAVGQAWQSVNLVLQPVRVPLFFLVSGYLAAPAVRRPWRQVVRRRVAAPYWVHVVWLVLGSAFFAVGPPLVTRTAHDVPELLLGLVLGYTNTWYLYALAAYFVVARWSVRLPLWLPVGAAVALAVVADTPLAWGIGSAPALLANLVFFLVPALRPGLLRALVARASTRTVLAALLVYLPLAAVAVATEVSRREVVSTLLSVLGTVAGLLLVVRVCAARPSAVRPLAGLGRRTLPVYVLHLPLLALVHAAVLALPAPPPGPAAELAAALDPVVVVVGLTAAALGLHALLVRCGLGALFRLPGAPR